MRRRSRSAAAKAGWITRRRKGKVVRRGLHRHVWKRPNAEHVVFKGFEGSHIKTLKPTLRTMDTTLSPHVVLNSTVHLSKRGSLEKRYKNIYGQKARVGALTYTGKKRSNIYMNPSTFDRHSYYDPRGTFSHEVGHVVHYSNSAAMRTYNKQFKSKSRGRRQHVDPYEDFAESFRTLQGFPITRKNRKYFHTTVDKARKEHIKTYYLR